MEWRRQAGLFRGGVNGEATPQLEEPEAGWDYEDFFPDSQPTPAQKRRGERDRRRVKEALERFSATVSYPYAGYEPDADPQPQPRVRQPSARQLRLARQALERFAAQIQRDMADPYSLQDDALQNSADQGAPLGSAATPRPGVRQPNPLQVLIHLWKSHL